MALINDNYFLRKKERSETMLEINLTFKGYYSPTDPNIPESTGIYCIYKTELEEKANDGHNGGQYRDWQKRIISHMTENHTEITLFTMYMMAEQMRRILED